MIKFERYPHIQDLFEYYSERQSRADIKEILREGVKTENDAEVIARFAWKMAEMINEDEEQGTVVLGNSDNTDMLPDLSYEMTKYMKSIGFYTVWEKISDEEMN